MSYSVKKAGIPFIPKVNVDPDTLATATNFSVSYVLDTDPTTNIAVTGSFTEGAKAGTFFAPAVTINSVGDYTFTISNTVDGLGNASTPIVVVNATMDDIKNAIDVAQADITAIKATTDLLNTTELENISEQITALQTTCDNVKNLIDDEDGSTMNSVMEFVEAINNALSDSGSGLGALSQYTDNLELMLEGKEYVDTTGTTISEADSKGLAEIFAEIEANGVAIADIDSDITQAVTDLNTSITNAKNEIISELGDVQTALETKIAEVKTIVESNSNVLLDAGFGLEALKDLIEALECSDNSDILDVLNNTTYGLEAIKNFLNTMDAKLDSIESKVDNIVSQSVVAFI